MNLSCHTYEWVCSSNPADVMPQSCHTCKKVMSPHINESCHIWMVHVSYRWVLSLRMNESCHIRMARVTYEWIVSRMNESWHTYEWVCSGSSAHAVPQSHQRYERVMSPRINSHVTYEWVTSRMVWVVSHMNESCHTYEWGRSVSSAHAVPQSCHRYEKVTSPRINSHVIYEWVMSHMDVSCHARVNHVTHMNGVEVVLPRMQCLGHMTDMTESCRHILIVMSHVNEWRHVTYEWVVSHVNESCYTYEWVRSGSSAHSVPRKCHTHERVMLPHINESNPMWMSHVTYRRIVSRMNESCHTYEFVCSDHSADVVPQSYHTYGRIMSPRINESCHTWHDSC